MSQKEGTTPASVAQKPTQAGEAQRQKWSWVEPTIWTERMLDALERGVKGGKWFALIDKVYDPRALHIAFTAVAGNAGAAGVDGQSVAKFEAHREQEIATLHPSPKCVVWPSINCRQGVDSNGRKNN